MSKYWLAQAAVYQAALQHGDIQNGRAVFNGDTFNAVSHLSPVITDMRELSFVPNEIKMQGMILVSDTSMNEVIQHLNSLLLMMYEGEEVLMTFYRPQIFIQLMSGFSDLDVSNFLGNIKEWYAFEEGDAQPKVYKRLESYVEQHPYQLQARPWWKLTAEQMKAFYSPLVHVNVLVRSLWNAFPAQLREHESTINDMVYSALNEAFKQDWSLEQERPPYRDFGFSDEEYCELYVLAKVCDNTAITCQQMSEAFRFNADEQFKLYDFSQSEDFVQYHPLPVLEEKA